MKISIVTPTYERMELLARLHESLLLQDGVNIEWIIVDDGGSDGTAKMVKSWPRSKNFEIYYRWQENSGKNVAANTGLDMATGDIVSIIDDDDYFLPHVFAHIQLDYLAIKDNPAIGGQSYLCHDGGGRVMGKHFPEDGMISDHIDCRINQNVVGDKCEFTKLIAIRDGNIRFPERNGALDTVYLVDLARRYKTKYYNYATLVKIFTNEGMSVNWRKRLLSTPDATALYYRAYLYRNVRFKVRVRYMVAYIAILRFMGKPADRSLMFEWWNVAPTLIAYFPGQLVGMSWKLQFKFGLTGTRSSLMTGSQP